MRSNRVKLQLMLFVSCTDHLYNFRGSSYCFKGVAVNEGGVLRTTTASRVCCSIVSAFNPAKNVHFVIRAHNYHFTGLTKNAPQSSPLTGKKKKVYFSSSHRPLSHPKKTAKRKTMNQESSPRIETTNRLAHVCGRSKDGQDSNRERIYSREFRAKNKRTLPLRERPRRQEESPERKRQPVWGCARGAFIPYISAHKRTHNAIFIAQRSAATRWQVH